MLSTTRLRINALLVDQRRFHYFVRNPAATLARSTWPPSLSRRGFAQHVVTPQGKRPAYIYPELIQIYRAPTRQTGANGIGRVVTIGLFIASVPLALNIYSNPEASNWWIPGGEQQRPFPSPPSVFDCAPPLTSLCTVLLGAALPMTLTILFCGPWTMAIQLNLPSRARRSREDLQRFVARLPPNAALALQFLRWKPWPTTRQVTFADLRRLQPSRIRMSNLEHIPDAVAARLQENRGLRAWMIRRYMGQFWVVMDDVSGGEGVVKDVWRQVWEQIPMEGEVAVKKELEALPAEFPAVKSEIATIAADAPRTNSDRASGLGKPGGRTGRPPPPVRGPAKWKQR
nr:hypothetical protein CFP56_09291 [Quercus suber]